MYRVAPIEDDSLLPNDLTGDVADECLARLREESRCCREVHNRLMGSEGYKKQAPEGDDEGQVEHWEQQARSPLFRSKRAGGFAALLAVRNVLLESAHSVSPAEAMDRLIGTAAGRRAVSQVIRRAKARSVGTCIADLTVCGAIPPYGPLLGGKLVAMLAVGPEMVRAYRRRYGDAVSIIASSMAGRPVVRPADLAFIGTTSLYGIRPCQYDRISIPLVRLGGPEGGSLKYEFMSTTRGWGTFQFGAATARAIGNYVKSQKDGVRVNYVFGEGASPRLRALREGLGALGFDQESLLHHGNPKLIYGVRLIRNLRDYLLGFGSKAKYLVSTRSPKTSTDSIVSWWIERWLMRRLRRDDSQDILAGVRNHTLVHPIIHGARVRLPEEELGQGFLFE